MSDWLVWRKWSEIAQSCLTLCDPMDCIVHGILQARILEWVSFPFSRGSSQPRDRTYVSRIAGGLVTSWATREAQYEVKRTLKNIGLADAGAATIPRLEINLKVGLPTQDPDLWCGCGSPSGRWDASMLHWWDLLRIHPLGLLALLAATHWRSWLLENSIHSLQKLPTGKTAGREPDEWDKLEVRGKPLPFPTSLCCPLMMVLSIRPTGKGEIFKGPSPFVQSRQQRLNLKCWGNKLIIGTPSNSSVQ